MNPAKLVSGIWLTLYFKFQKTIVTISSESALLLKMKEMSGSRGSETLNSSCKVPSPRNYSSSYNAVKVLTSPNETCGVL